MYAFGNNHAKRGQIAPQPSSKELRDQRLLARPSPFNRTATAAPLRNRSTELKPHNPWSSWSVAPRCRPSPRQPEKLKGKLALVFRWQETPSPSQDSVELAFDPRVVVDGGQSVSQPRDGLPQHFQRPSACEPPRE
jgi:uncharacterized membrane protein